MRTLSKKLSYSCKPFKVNCIIIHVTVVVIYIFINIVALKSHFNERNDRYWTKWNLKIKRNLP